MRHPKSIRPLIHSPEILGPKTRFRPFVVEDRTGGGSGPRRAVQEIADDQREAPKPRERVDDERVADARFRVGNGPLRRIPHATMRASAPTMPAARPSHVGRTLTAARGRPGPVLAAGTKKVVTYDDGWKKEFFGTGLFLEDGESKSVDVLERVQKKKLLSSVEKSGLLSLAEKSGLTLSKIEKWGLLSTAEKLGLLSLLENAATTEPAVISSLSLPFLVLAVLGATLIPDDNTVEVIVKTLFCGVSFGTFAALFAGGFVVAGLQED